MKKLVALALAGPLCSASSFAAAPYDLKINGFLSVGAAWSNVDFQEPGVQPIYVSFIDKRPTFDKDSNVGLQVTKFLTDEVSITVQLVAKQAYTDWFVDASWAFLKWEPNDNWQFRVGRIRTNPYMLSDYVDIAYAYPWIRPPQEVYSQIPTLYSNFTGIDARFKMQICDQDLALTAFYGQSTSNQLFPAGPNTTIMDNIDTKMNDLVSLNLKFGTEVFSIRAGWESARVTLYPNAGSAMQGLNTFMNTMVAGVPFFGPQLSPAYTNYFSGYNFRTAFTGVGYQFDWKNIVSMGEVVKRSSQSPIMANVMGWYLMGGYRCKNIMPHVTFGRERLLYGHVWRFPGLVNQFFQGPPINSPVDLDTVAKTLIGTSPFYDGGAGDQSSVTYGVRWDVIDGVALKAEVCHVHPDRMGKGLFDIQPYKSVNIYSIALNAVM